MKSLITVCCIAVLSIGANSAFAADANCEAKAAEKKLAGAAKTSFMKKCEAEAKSGGASACEAKAEEKKLAGAAKGSFIKKCEADAKGGSATSEAKADDATAKCEASAKEKKLAGAAKTSHVKKCIAEAKGEAKK